MATKTVKVGNILIGGGNRISIQSMTNIKTSDIEKVIVQINELKDSGCDIVRLAIKDMDDALAIKAIKERTDVPLVGDIHFDYRLAIEAIKNGIHKIRINPGNIGRQENVEEVAKALKDYNVPVRVGSNTGSIEKEFLNKYGRSEISLAESALKNVSILEKCGVDNIVISAKASDVPLMVKTYRYLNSKCDYPLHIGVTEAGTKEMGTIKNAVGIGSLLLDGIGDTIRVSLTDNPVEEVRAAKNILNAVGLGGDHIDVVSCPTCGRTEYDLISLAKLVEDKYRNVNKKLKIAVMGCVVNGPGEAMDADIGIAGSKEFCVIFKKGMVYRKVPAEDASTEFIKEIDEMLWK